MASRPANGTAGQASTEVDWATIARPDPPFVGGIKEHHAAALTRCDADENDGSHEDDFSDDFGDDFSDDFGDGDDDGESDAENDGESDDSYDIEEYHLRERFGRPYDSTVDVFRDRETDRNRERDRNRETDAEAETGLVEEPGRVVQPGGLEVPWYELQEGEKEREELAELAARKMSQWSDAELMELAAAVVFCRHSGKVTIRSGGRGDVYWRQVWRAIRLTNPEWRRIPTAMAKQWTRMKARYDAETHDPRRKRRRRKRGETGRCPAEGMPSGEAEQPAGGGSVEQRQGGSTNADEQPNNESGGNTGAKAKVRGRPRGGWWSGKKSAWGPGPEPAWFEYVRLFYETELQARKYVAAKKARRAGRVSAAAADAAAAAAKVFTARKQPADMPAYAFPESIAHRQGTVAAADDLTSGGVSLRERDGRSEQRDRDGRREQRERNETRFPRRGAEELTGGGKDSSAGVSGGRQGERRGKMRGERRAERRGERLGERLTAAMGAAVRSACIQFDELTRELLHDAYSRFEELSQKLAEDATAQFEDIARGGLSQRVANDASLQFEEIARELVEETVAACRDGKTLKRR
ncbi:unnamed protein product [Closterium sp. NIES-65]|nr:unnamed protein product [Closterium sp. NIES-65]